MNMWGSAWSKAPNMDMNPRILGLKYKVNKLGMSTL